MFNKFNQEENEKIINLVSLENGEPTTTSLLIAETFDKNHYDVIHKIESLQQQIEDTEFFRSPQMFEKSKYLTSQNKLVPMYYLNRDGFTLLAMGFTGQKALEWKLKYIQAFNAMEEKLKNTAVVVSNPIDNRAEVAKLILKASKCQIAALKELYSEYFPHGITPGSFEELIDSNTSYQKWLEDYNINVEWIGSFPTNDIYNAYKTYCVENRYNKTLGKKQFYARIEFDFNLIRKQKPDGFRYFSLPA